MKIEFIRAVDAITESKNFFYENIHTALYRLSLQAETPTRDIYKCFVTGSNSSVLKMLKKMEIAGIVECVKYPMNYNKWKITESGKELL